MVDAIHCSVDNTDTAAHGQIEALDKVWQDVSRLSQLRDARLHEALVLVSSMQLSVAVYSSSLTSAWPHLTCDVGLHFLSAFGDAHLVIFVRFNVVCVYVRIVTLYINKFNQSINIRPGGRIAVRYSS